MTKLAIKGHATRGNEVIEILEMLGGKIQSGRLAGDAFFYWYYISEDGYIEWKHYSVFENNVTVFTLEEFLEKYPFKVGDKVLIPEYESEVRICKMRWSSVCNYVEYKVYRNDDPEWYSAEELLEYNADFLVNREYGTVAVETLDNMFRGTLYEKEILEKEIASFKIVEGYCADEVKIEFDESKFEMVERDNSWFVVKKKPKYPKTYKECCEVLGITFDFPDIRDVSNAEFHLYSNFIRLIRCRDAYWKIAGEELGLKEPWKPDWTDNEFKYCITVFGNMLECVSEMNIQCILAFPTEEMRDAFYENFKGLIENCKELL